MFGVSRFKDKVAVIAGAGHPVARTLCLRLAAFGATVVALDQDEDRLLRLARQAPDQIEPLTLVPGRRDVLALLGEAWGESPVDFYADFWPMLRAPSEGDQPDGFGCSPGLAAALTAGLAAARGVGMIAIPQDGNLGLTANSYESMLTGLSVQLRPVRLLGLRLPQSSANWREADCISAGDLALLLFHPVSRGLKSGSVVDWTPEQP